MRIVIDLQGAQTSGSCNRGIGRYSLALAQAMVRVGKDHEFIIALNNVFPESIESIRSVFQPILPRNQIKVWEVSDSINSLTPDNHGRRQAGEKIREAFLRHLQPDFIHVTSLFEGLGEDACTSIGTFMTDIPTAVTLYDLIPHIYKLPYLESPTVNHWYQNKLDHLRRADVLLAISESSRQEGVTYLGFPENRVINISTGAEPHFQSIHFSLEQENAFRHRYQLLRPFVMYTGGVDSRKNVKGLIRAYANMPMELRKTHQLVIVCAMRAEKKIILEQFVRKQGLAADEVVFTGFVSEDDLVMFYNLCQLFIFPSLHEGFGIPVLEAMRCGAPVIGSNTSSIPEVIGFQEALFDPHSDNAMTEKLIQGLTDKEFRKNLLESSLKQVKCFSWEASAAKALAAMEKIHAEKAITLYQQQSARPKLAYISPLLPEQSGIADYSAALLPELARFYDIDVIVNQKTVVDTWVLANSAIRQVDWFLKNYKQYDRVLYHIGNSAAHKHMLPLLNRVPGVIVLHDFYLSGLHAYVETTQYIAYAWIRELYHSHGYFALQERFHTEDFNDIRMKYPCNFRVLKNAKGVIAHSPYSYQLALQWYGNTFTKNNWIHIPLLRAPIFSKLKQEIRCQLKLEKDDFVVCSFGITGPTKQSHRLLKAWLASDLAQDSKCKLIFVGKNDATEYGNHLLKEIAASAFRHRITITEWADSEMFQNYLAATDIAVQLRAFSQGETSGAVLDCMNHGIPTIVNANGTMSDLPKNAVLMLEDQFSDDDLIQALEYLWKNSDQRNILGNAARTVIQEDHSPRQCAAQYKEAIETFYAQTRFDRHSLIEGVAKIGPMLSEQDCKKIAKAISQNMPDKMPARQLFIDVSSIINNVPNVHHIEKSKVLLKKLMSNPPTGYRVEPIYIPTNASDFFYARKFTLNWYDCPETILSDELIEPQCEDIYLNVTLPNEDSLKQTKAYAFFRLLGIKMYTEASWLEEMEHDPLSGMSKEEYNIEITEA